MKPYALPVGLLTALELAFPPYIARFAAGVVRLGRDMVWSMSHNLTGAQISVDWEMWTIQWFASTGVVIAGIWITRE
jgi:hypothetical protein